MISAASQSMLGAVYSADLRELGADGFQKWLTNCYSGHEPKLIGPHFIDEELDFQPFGDVFAKVIPELSDEEVAIARAGSACAFKSFRKDKSTYEGLYNLARLAEALQHEHASDTIFEILSGAFDAGSEDAPNYSEAYYLRETLEVLFRLVAMSREAPSNKKTICAWAFRLATESPYPKKLKFALAPLYVMGRLHARDAAPSRAKETFWANRLDGSLLEGFREDNDLFHEFYFFEWEGEYFPYDVERLRLEMLNWLSSGTTVQSERKDADSAVVQIVSLRTRYAGRPPLGEEGKISATSGRLGAHSKTTPKQLLGAIEGQLG